MTTVASQTTVDDTSGGTALHTGDAGVAGARLVIKNASATDAVALGPSGLTFLNGFQLGTGATINIDLVSGDALSGICAAGKTAVVHILKAGE